MNEELILERNFIFDADDEKGYKKLRDNQFPRVEQGIVYEPLANALDQQQGNRPVEINLEQAADCYKLTYHDNGVGLTEENLEALHFIGKSTKREKKEDFIGRFGMGLTGAFNSRLQLQKVEIETMVCGKAGKISYNCSGDGIPTWKLEKLEKACEGFSLSFFIPSKNVPLIKKAIELLLRNTVVPIRYNGKLYHRPPSDIVQSKHDIMIHMEEDPEIYYCAHIAKKADSNFYDDSLRIYLRGLPVEEGAMYHMLISTYGGKMAQNYYDRPFMKDESCVVLSRKAEPTVGRDKLVRNGEFDRIKFAIEKARALALHKLLKKSRSKDAVPPVATYGKEMAIANLCSLKSAVTSYLKSGKAPGDREYLAPLLEELISYPLFPAFGIAKPLSLKEIAAANPLAGVYFFADSEDGGSFLFGYHECPFILEEYRYKYSPIWGFHEMMRLESVLKPIIDSVEGKEMVKLEDLMFNDVKLSELQNRGAITVRPLKISVIDSPANEFLTFLDNLRGLLNQPWFRRAVQKYRPPRRIHLRLINIVDGSEHGETIAAILNEKKNDEDFYIGLNGDSSTIRSLVNSPNGHIAFLPILCHELAHKKKTIAGENETVMHGEAFYFDRVRIESSVLSSCVRYLLGEEIEDEDGMEADGEVVVL